MLEFLKPIVAMLVGVGIFIYIVLYIKARHKTQATMTIVDHLQNGVEALIVGKIYRTREGSIVHRLECQVLRANVFSATVRLTHLWKTQNGNWFMTDTIACGKKIVSCGITPFSVEKAKEALRDHYILT